jgi:CRISPR-associated endonuclease/helicase Cas3
VLCDADTPGPPPESFGKGIECVYDRYILLRTWLALRGRQTIEVPTEIEVLIEAVYGESALIADSDWAAALRNAKEETEFGRAESEKAAHRLLMSQPTDPSDLVEQFNDQLADDEAPEVHKTVRAATREGDPSVTVVMLPADAGLTPNPDIPETRRLLDLSAKLSHKGLFHLLCEQGECPGEWMKNAHLRHARLLPLDGQDRGHVGPYTVAADYNLGVVIEKDGEAHD